MRCHKCQKESCTYDDQRKKSGCSKKCGYEYRSILKEHATGKKGVKL